MEIRAFLIDCVQPRLFSPTKGWDARTPPGFSLWFRNKVSYAMDEGYSEAEVLFMTAAMDVLQASEREKT